jgi:CRISPR-associated endonuclease/helicase Cas3
MMDFETFFRVATGCQPYGYQARIARDGLPDVIRVPAGAGKTGVILAWLWRRLYGPDPDRTPRRLVYALPQRAILDEVSGSVRTWLGNLGLSDQVAVHVVQGARSARPTSSDPTPTRADPRATHWTIISPVFQGNPAQSL